MKVKTAELKRFKANASFIKTNNILPILGYLKFKDRCLTKTNLHNFYEQEMDFKEEMLVDETILYNFLSNTAEEVIDISIKGDRVIISDSKSKVFSQMEHIENFPNMPDPETEPVKIPSEVFYAIKYASNFCDFMELQDHRAHVFIGNKSVSATNNFIGYCEKFKEIVPEMVLLKEVANVLGKFESASFMENEKHIFFDLGKAKYSFIKSYFVYSDISKIFVLDKKVEHFIVDKNDILSFADLCVGSVKAKGLLANMSMKGKKLNLSMIDAGFNVEVTRVVEVEGSVSKDFNFNPEYMSTLLKNIPDTTLTFYRNEKSLTITGESGFLAIILELAPINNN